MSRVSLDQVPLAPLVTPLSPVSVLVTCYNLERFIGEALASVFAQQDAPPFEVIVVDDCSTDRSAGVIRSFPDIRYLKAPANRGVLLAMIAGVEQARHDIVCLLDGDDYWEPAKLARIAAAFDQDPGLGLVTHDLSFIDAAGRFSAQTSRPGKILSPLKPEAQRARMRDAILDQDDSVWLGSALSFRRTLARWDEFNRFASALPDPQNCYQDWPLAFWIASHADVSLGYVPEPLLRYRIHGSNHSGDATTSARAARNFQRTANSRDAMEKIARMHGLRSDRQRRARLGARLAQASANLYAGNRLSAVAGFLSSLAFARHERALLKEIARFALGAALGPRALIFLTGVWKRAVEERRSKMEPSPGKAVGQGCN